MKIVGHEVCIMHLLYYCTTAVWHSACVYTGACMLHSMRHVSELHAEQQKFIARYTVLLFLT